VVVNEMSLHPAHSGKGRLADPALEVPDAVVHDPHVCLQAVLAAEGKVATVTLEPSVQFFALASLFISQPFRCCVAAPLAGSVIRLCRVVELLDVPV
jgi:hypothetical protein